jgi:hypothetical protein
MTIVSYGYRSKVRGGIAVHVLLGDRFCHVAASTPGLKFPHTTSEPFMRARRLAVALGAAVALGLAVMPAASAATDVVTIANPGNGIGFPNLGEVWIPVTSTTPLTELNVTLTSAADPDVLSFTIADFRLQAGTSTDGTWVFDGHITDAQLPFGTYTIEITAGDSGGGSASNDLTSLVWLIQPSITLTASQTVISYDDPSVTFSGNLSLDNPDGSALPASELAGQPLLLTDKIDPDLAITTGAGGAYSITVDQPVTTYYAVTFTATSTMFPATSGQIWISSTQDPVQISAQASATQLSDGQAITVTGTAEYNPGSGFVPLQNSTVEVYGTWPASQNPAPPVTAVTNSQGVYTVSFADDDPGPLYVYAGGLPGNTFLNEILAETWVATPYVHVTLPLTITKLHATLSRFAILTLTGCLIAGNVDFPHPPVLQAEYATTPSGPWHILTTVQGVRPGNCGTTAVYGEPFRYRVPVALASAYYRLSGASAADFEPAVSQVVHEAKTLTRITNFTISPRTVTTKGTVITVSGRLWKDTKGWHPLVGQSVWIMFRYKGVWYYFRHKPKTSASGRFSGKFTAYLGGPFVAEYMGSKAYFASTTTQLKVKATGRSAAALAHGVSRSLWPAASSARPVR